MPIHFDGRTFEKFTDAVEHVKRTKKGVRDPNAFVAAVEKRQLDARKTFQRPKRRGA